MCFSPSNLKTCLRAWLPTHQRQTYFYVLCSSHRFAASFRIRNKKNWVTWSGTAPWSGHFFAARRRSRVNSDVSCCVTGTPRHQHRGAFARLRRSAERARGVIRGALDPNRQRTVASVWRLVDDRWRHRRT